MPETINHLVFPTLIRTHTSYLNKNQCQTVIDFARDKASSYEKVFKEEGKAISTYSNYPNILDILGDTFMNNLMSDIYSYKEDLSYYFRRRQETITTSWVNFQRKGSVLKEHVHGCLIVGVIFLKVDDDSSHLYFHNPNPHVHTYGFDDTKNHTASKIQVTPKEGDLLMFPGWMSHGSDREKNNSEERIVCSFNYG